MADRPTGHGSTPSARAPHVRAENRRAPPAPVLLYDGSCGLCARSVQFVLARERPESDPPMLFATLQGRCGAEILSRFPRLSGVDSVVLHIPATESTSEAALARSDAALAVMTYLGGAWKVVASVMRIVPAPVRDAVYDVIARHRHKLAGSERCLLPTPAQRARFLDDT